MISFEHAQFAFDVQRSRLLTVDISISKGDVVALLGLNGSGKSTLLDAITGFKKPMAGVIHGISDLRCGYSVQDATSGLLPWKTILDNVLFPCALLPKNDLEEATQRAKAWLAEYKLADRENSYPYQLSGGEKQAINMIRAICTPANVFLFDEPYSALGTSARRTARRLLESIIATKTIVITTHDPDELEFPFTRWLLIEHGVTLQVDRIRALAFLHDGQ